MFGRNSEIRIALASNPYRADIVTGSNQQNVETIFRPDYTVQPSSPLGWKVDVPRSATVITHTALKGVNIIRGSLPDEYKYVDSHGYEHIRELNPEVAEVTALCLDPLYTAQKSLRQLFGRNDDELTYIWDDNLDPLQQQLAEGINARPLVRGDDLTPKDERQISYMLAAEHTHSLLDFSGSKFVHQAIAVAGGLERVSDEVIEGIRRDINQQYIQRYIKNGIDFGTLT